MSAIDNMIKRLTSAYSKEPDSNNYKLLSISADECDEIETTISDIKSAHFVDFATDVSLDNLGSLLQTFRETGESDADFRIRLKIIWKQYSSSGTIKDIKEIIELLVNITGDRIHISDHYIAGRFAHFDVWVHKDDLDAVGITTSDLKTLLESLKGAGIAMDVYLFGTYEAVDIDATWNPDYNQTETGVVDLAETSNNYHHTDVTFLNSLNVIA